MSSLLAHPRAKYFLSTHFWGPVANWGFVLAGLVDLQKDPHMISPNMTSALCVYSALFMRFSLVIKPRNLLLFSCHLCNEAVQLTNLGRWANWRYTDGVVPHAESPRVEKVEKVDKEDSSK
eukprot:TRINITY_DN5418_c0_g1_i1.p2 TRINITY_DN5418_c0_g1~~TRINITY_DN5418_c0_g1_i1.p2  ORF type:complete len:135 (-),score=13.88 TRINITY_DN5418_c0_g1_i1:7-369(-)